MPKKVTRETQAEQSDRFKKNVQKLIDDGELSPTADADFARLVRAAKQRPQTE